MTDSDKLPQFLVKLAVSYPVVYYAVSKITSSQRLSSSASQQLVKVFVSGFVSSFYSYKSYTNAVAEKSKANPNIVKSRLDNISAEVTALVLARAIDSLIRQFFKSTLLRGATSPVGTNKRARYNKVVKNYDVFLFILGSFVIMFNWFYYPLRMQSKYRNWITAMANMDEELTTALRLIRDRDIEYGVESKNSSILEETAVKYNLPREYGDISKVSKAIIIFFLSVICFLFCC